VHFEKCTLSSNSYNFGTQAKIAMEFAGCVI